MVLPDRLNEIERRIARLDDAMDKFDDALTTLKGPKVDILAILALKEIRERLGKEGLIDLIKWSVHPRSGFLLQTLTVKPLPESLKPVLANIVNEVNHTIDTAIPQSRWKNLKAGISAEEDSHIDMEEAAGAAAYALNALLFPQPQKSHTYG